MLLRLLFIALFTFAQSNGNSQDTKDIEKVLKTFIQAQLQEVEALKAEVESIVEKLNGVKEERNNGNVALLKQVDAPQSCLNLLATADDPCPDFQKILGDTRTVLSEIYDLMYNGISAYKSTFENEEYKCTDTLNPLTALKCFLRAFRAAHNSLLELKDQVTKLKDDAENLFEEFNQYRTDCKKPDELQERHLQILYLCKKIHEVNSQ